MKNDDDEDKDMKKRMSLKKNWVLKKNIIFQLFYFIIDYLAFFFFFLNQ